MLILLFDKQPSIFPYLHPFIGPQQAVVVVRLRLRRRIDFKVSEQSENYCEYLRTKPAKHLFERLRKFYQQYKEYVRVDLVMYAVMILLIVIYIIYTLVAA